MTSVHFEAWMQPHAESDADSDAKTLPRKGIYLLPNLFTTATLFGGFYAIVAAMNGRFSDAALGIFAAMVADALDGRVARLTNTQSSFGKEYDSLADMVSFGLAAALVMYLYSLQHLANDASLGGKLGWLAAFVYVACTALRLARFNVNASLDGGKGDFFGLPSPSAAALMAGFVWIADDFQLSGDVLRWPAVVLTLAAGALMVSNVRYPSFKQIKVAERVPFVYLLIMLGIMVLVAFDPPRVLGAVFVSYALAGPIMTILRMRKRRLRS